MKRHLLFVLISLALPVLVFAQSDQTPEPTPEATAAAAPASTTAPATNADWTPVIQSINNLDMALVPAGSFTIGTSKEDVDALFADCEQVVGQGQCQYEWFGRETPQSTVTFDQPFWISRTEITNAQYGECVTAGTCTPPSDTTAFADSAFADYPVVYVTWEQANQYADWFGGRLPNEAEWEYAARGVDSLVYPWGNDFDSTRLNFCDTTCPRDQRGFDSDDGHPELAPVGAYPNGASWVGALDLSGNVSEWTLTMYEEKLYLYPYDPSDGRNDRVTERLDARIVRGGSWESVQRDTRAATRTAIPYPMDGKGDIGFRVVADYTP